VPGMPQSMLMKPASERRMGSVLGALLCIALLCVVVDL
jgi:hypothetical protein